MHIIDKFVSRIVTLSFVHFFIILNCESERYPLHLVIFEERNFLVATSTSGNVSFNISDILIILFIIPKRSFF